MVLEEYVSPRPDNVLIQEEDGQTHIYHLKGAVSRPVSEERQTFSNAYELYHGSGGLPAATSQWDFAGPLAAGATELSVTVR